MIFRMTGGHTISRTPLSLANYAFRSVIRNDVIDNSLIEPLLSEYNGLDKFEGDYLVSAIEFRLENYYQCMSYSRLGSNPCIPSDRYSWNTINLINSPDVGDDISISRNGVNFKIRGTFDNSLNLDIDWSDHVFHHSNGHYFHHNPYIHQSIYFENGQINVKQWYNWHNGLGSFTCSPRLPDPCEFKSIWELGNMQSLSMKSDRNLIWTYSQIHNYDPNVKMFPPLLKTTWICKAVKISSFVPTCSKKCNFFH